MNNKRIIIGVTIGIIAAILWSVVFINVLNSMAGIGIEMCIRDRRPSALRNCMKSIGCGVRKTLCRP